MPLKLVDSSDNEVALDKVEFIKENDQCYFRVANSENVGINFEYVPIAVSNWDKARFEIYLFENPYLDAENDVFEVYEDTISDERLGWIFPIAILESNNNDYKDFKNLNNYKFVAYQKLLELNVRIDAGKKADDFLKLSSVFNNPIICILSIDTIKKVENFKFEAYLLSFYKYGYLQMDAFPKAKKIYDRGEFVKEMRNRKRVVLTNSKFDITENAFTKSLFVEHLLQTESHVMRFIFLYQIIEHFIQIKSDAQFHVHINNYMNKKIAKNDFKEAINNSSRERDLVRDLINESAIRQELKNEFISECGFLFADVGLVSKNNFADKIYDLRNLITHRLRELTDRSKSLNKITEIFEQIIVELLTSYQDK